MAGVGATGAGTTAGAAGAAGLNGASGANQGYRDPESGQWVGGSPPLTLPSLSSLEQLAMNNPVIGPVYRAYVAMAQATANVVLSEGGDKPSLIDPKGEAHILAAMQQAEGIALGLAFPGRVSSHKVGQMKKSPVRYRTSRQIHLLRERQLDAADL